MAISTDIINQALRLMGHDAAPVTGVAPGFDSSVAGKVAASIYAPTIATVARQHGWDFTRKSTPLTSTGNAPFPPWSQEYLYPSDAVQIWQVMPPIVALDLNNPLPILWQVANNTVNGGGVRVIQTDVANAIAVYACLPPESSWDSLFREAVVSLLASEFAMALAGKPDAMAALHERGAAFEQIGEGRDG